MNKFDIPFADNFTFFREDVHVHFSKPRPAETTLQFVYGEINYEVGLLERQNKGSKK